MPKGVLSKTGLGVTFLELGMRKALMKRLMTWTTVGSIISEEVGTPIVIRGVTNEELPERDGLLNSKVVDQPADSVISNPKSCSSIL